MEKKQVQRRYSVIQFLFWAVCIGGIYITAYLKEIGFSATQIGITSSCGALFGMILLPRLGELSDRLGSAKYPFIASMGIVTVLLMFFPLIAKVFPVAPVVVILYGIIAIMFRMQQISLADGYCISKIGPYGIPFTSIRIWGSLGYATISAIVTILVTWFLPMASVFYVVPLAFLPLTYLVLHDDKTSVAAAGQSDAIEQVNAEQKPKKPSFRAAFRNYYFVIYLLLSLGLNVQQGITSLYQIYIYEAAGVSSIYVALFTGFRALFEMLSMFICMRLRATGKIKMWQILIFSGVFFTIEHILYPSANGFFFLFLIMVPSGLASGIHFGVAPNYIYEIVDDNVRNTCQTINGTCTAIVSIVGTLIGGLVVDKYGIFTLTNINLCILVCMTTIFIVGNLIGPRVAKGQKNA